VSPGRLLDDLHQVGLYPYLGPGGRLLCAGPREALTADLVARVRPHVAELTALLQRVEAFREQAFRGPVSLLALPGTGMRKGRCWSCGEPLEASDTVDVQSIRCKLCREAAWIALRPYLPPFSPEVFTVAPPPQAQP
jgi:hypothetical protein